MLRRGKIPEQILKRSVLRQLDITRDDVISGPGIGQGGGCVDPEGSYMVFSTSGSAENIPDRAYYEINRAMNHLASMKAEPVGITVNITGSSELEEAELKALMIRINEVCRGFSADVISGNIEITENVKDTVLTFTGIGKKENKLKEPVISGECAVIVTKCIALEGTAILAQIKEKELSEHYCSDIIREAKRFKEHISVIEEAEALKDANVILHDLSRGGILSGLWEIGEKTGMGMDIDMRKVPVKQETVEICEFLSLNPYCLLSGGAMLVIAEDEEETLRLLGEKGIPGAVAGYLHPGNDRIIRFGETKGFLNRPAADEIYKII